MGIGPGQAPWDGPDLKYHFVEHPMAHYATCECEGCHIRIPKPEAYRVTLERKIGRSSGSITVGRSTSYSATGKTQGHRDSTSYSTGREYYANKDIWLRQDCYLEFRKERRLQALPAIVAVAFTAAISLPQTRSIDGETRSARRARSFLASP